MLRRLPMAPFALSVLLAGCAHPAPPPPPAPPETGSYVCRPNDGPGSEQHLTVRPDDQRTGLLMKIGNQSNWRALAVVAGSSGLVYADTNYAWRANGASGVLTDIRNIQTYNCTADGAAAGSAK